MTSSVALNRKNDAVRLRNDLNYEGMFAMLSALQEEAFRAGVIAVLQNNASAPADLTQMDAVLMELNIAKDALQRQAGVNHELTAELERLKAATKAAAPSPECQETANTEIGQLRDSLAQTHAELKRVSFDLGSKTGQHAQLCQDYSKLKEANLALNNELNHTKTQLCATQNELAVYRSSELFKMPRFPEFPKMPDLSKMFEELGKRCKHSRFVTPASGNDGVEAKLKEIEAEVARAIQSLQQIHKNRFGVPTLRQSVDAALATVGELRLRLSQMPLDLSALSALRQFRDAVLMKLGGGSDAGLREVLGQIELHMENSRKAQTNQTKAESYDLLLHRLRVVTVEARRKWFDASAPAFAIDPKDPVLHTLLTLAN